MPEGTYVKMGKPDGLSYPRSMMQEVIKDPIESSEPPDKVPEFLEKQKLFSREMSCFSNSNMGVAAAGIHTPDRPVLHSPNPALTQSAEDAVRQWKYEPYLLQGKPVAVHIEIVIQYLLNH